MFYFSLPFLAWFARRIRYTVLLLCIAGVLAGLGQIAVARSGSSDFVAFLFTFTHYFIHTFSLGILVASLPLARFSAVAKGPIATIVSLLLLGGVLAFVPARYGVLETCALAIPFVCICLGNTWCGFLSSRSMRFLGRISYSFYLLHLELLTMILTIAGKFGYVVGVRPFTYWMLSFGAGVVIIFICAFSYQWLEHPFLHVSRIGNPFAAARRAKLSATIAPETPVGTPEPGRLGTRTPRV
jgi:peptidoglycan/LPS O-acetylase OafA/YrhL